MTIFTSYDLTMGKPIPGYGAAGGQNRTQFGYVDLPAVVTTSDVINLFYLPPHSIVHGVRLLNPAAGGGTLQIGDTGAYDDAGNVIAASAARYLAATAITTAGTSNTLALPGVFFYTGAKKVLIQATLATGPTTTAGRYYVSIGFTTEEPQGRTP